MRHPDFLRGMGDSGFREYHNADTETGGANRYGYLKHVNVHRKPHLLELEHPLQANEAFQEIEENVILASSPTGTVFAFSTESGKYWEYNGNTVDIIGTNPHATQGHKGARVYNGFVLFVSKTNQVGSFLESNYLTVNYNNGVLHSSTLTVPIVGIYGSVYIGSGSEVVFFDLANADYGTGELPPFNTTQVSQAFFSSEVDTLRLPLDWKITDMIQYGNELLVGLAANNSGAVVRWKPYSGKNFYGVDFVDGIVNFFFRSYNQDVVFAVVGNDPEIYTYQNSRLDPTQIINDIKAVPNPYASGVIDGMPVFALENRVYSYHQRKSGYNFALVHSFTCTGGRDAIISSIASVDYPTSGDQIYISWFNPVLGTTGVDCIDYDSWAEGEIVTPIKQWTQESAHDARNAKQQVEPKDGYQVLYHYDPAHFEEDAQSVDIKVAVNHQVEERDPQVYPQCHDPGRMAYQQNTILDADSESMYTEVRLTQAHIKVKPFNGKSPLIKEIELL